jgi:DNA-binding winged helix-turn-helix (wHTH) protein
MAPCACTAAVEREGRKGKAGQQFGGQAGHDHLLRTTENRGSDEHTQWLVMVLYRPLFCCLSRPLFSSTAAMLSCLQSRKERQGCLLYLFNDFALDTDRRELRRGAKLVSVAPQVFDLLEYLIRHRERVVSKNDLLAAIWDGRIVSNSALSTRINAARCAISDSGEEQRLIRTAPRKGVRFIGEVREEQAPALVLQPMGVAGAEHPGPIVTLQISRQSPFFRLVI